MGITVKIWYGSGAFEDVPDIPTADLAATIYAEADGNPNVVAGELHRADGSVAASFDHRAGTEGPSWTNLLQCTELRDNSLRLSPECG